MGTSYHNTFRRIDLVSKIYSHPIVYASCVYAFGQQLRFWSAVMFSVSLHSVFAVKPAGTRELAEVEEMHINESPEEVPSLGKHKLTV